MPQPALSLRTYLGNALPELRGEPPAGAGGKARPAWPEGTLQTLVQVPDFAEKVSSYLERLPDQPVPAHPARPFPHLASASRTLNLSSEATVLKAVNLVLSSTHATLSALDLLEHPLASGGGVESAIEADGHDGVVNGDAEGEGGERVGLRFGKSPMGETEFIFVDADKKPVLVVRVLTTPFHARDWADFFVSGPYRYNPKSRASWMWSRMWGATSRIGVSHFILTDYTNWVFGAFSPDRTTANVSPIVAASVSSKAGGGGPTVLEGLTYWVRSALGHEGGFKLLPALESNKSTPAAELFPDNPARHASAKHKTGERPRPEGRTAARLAEESDVEDSDVAE